VGLFSTLLDHDQRAISVPLTPVKGGRPRSLTGSRPPRSALLSRTIMAICKQGVRGSSPLSSTSEKSQVRGSFPGLWIDLHETFFRRRARCVPDRLPAAVPRARRGLRFSSPAARSPSASAISRCRSSVECNGTVGYRSCLNASAWPPYPQKIAVGSRSISRRRSSMCGDGGSWS
jgi:hypothetical protein